MKLKFLFISLLFGLVFGGHSVVHAQDTTTVNKVWTEEQWKEATEDIEYKKQPEKEKEKEEVEEEETDQKSADNDVPKKDISQWLTNLFSSSTAKIIVIIFIALLLIITIYFLMKNSSAKDRKVQLRNLEDLENTNEDISETDLERFLRLSLDAGDYKTAVRVLYLTSLQTLHVTSVLVWKKDKTNQDYILDMRNHPGYTDFRNLTFIYEYVWYGDQLPNSAEYESINKLFKKFNDSLKGGYKN